MIVRGVLAVLLLATSSAFADAPSPFNMSTEKPAAAPAQPEPGSATAQPAPAPGATKPAPPPAAQPAQTPAAPAPASAQPAVVAAQPTPTQAISRRYLLPFENIVFSGESTQRAWTLYLTPEQASSRASLNLGYQNAVIVAPESSRLRLTINGKAVVDIPIASSDNPSALKFPVPVGLLHAGMNEVAVSAVQRHRTDCTIESTYELWTQIDSASTYLSFEDPEAGRWRRIEDVRAIGADAKGSTTFNLIVPAMEQTGSAAPLVRLAEALALMANMPNQSFEISEQARGMPRPGAVNVVVGSASEIAEKLEKLPEGAQVSPTSAIVDDPKLGPSTVVITGPNWQAVEQAIEDIARPVDRPVASQRVVLATRNWRLPETPMVLAARHLKFSDLGVSTQEFSGRRLRTEFNVGIPSDFYANAYGQAMILLDAAYSQDVLPGSHIDIYVNDNIAATVPITTSGGEILRHLPIKVTMRHFRPGDNSVAIEAVLLTQADATCAPGATGLQDKRFVLFDSSELVMPDFARIGRTPNLSAVSGTGFPYNRADYSLPLIFERTQPEAMSAATTLMAQMSVAAGRLIPVDTAVSPAAVMDRNAVFVGAIPTVPSAVLAELGITSNVASKWGEAVASNQPNTDTTFDEWRQKLRGSGWRGQVSSFEDWMNRTFNISMNSFRLLPGRDPDFTPSNGSTLLVAQKKSPTGEGSWTLVTAPSPATLQQGMRTLAQQDVWRQLGGRIATIDGASSKVAQVPVSSFEFVETEPFSLQNYRLIIANWLSANALAYALVLICLSIALGLATARLLGSLGRKQ